MLKMLTWYCRVATVVQFFLLLVMLVVMASLVVTRYAFSYSPPWSEEVTGFAMIWMVLLGGSVLSLFEDHITLYAFVEKMGPKARFVQLTLVRSIMAITSGVIAWKGIGFVKGMSGVIAWGTNITMTLPTLSVPIAFFMICVMNILLLSRDLMLAADVPTFDIPKQSSVMDGSFRPSE